ncbi:MAG: helix-turn-helix domain-containing protein [Anaerolineae bacterium]
MSVNLINTIFGMKVRQSRTEAGLTLTEFAAQCELSPSYLTEIEKGRKYPRADKIMRMAEVFGKPYDDLVSIKLAPSLAYLESALSSSIARRFPFGEFGFEAGDMVNLLTNQPDRASALLHALLSLGRRYDLQEADFLLAALRSYQEIHENYFQDVEDAALTFVEKFSQKYGFPADPPVQLPILEQILAEEFGYQIDDKLIGENPALAMYRSVVVEGKRPSLLINSVLFPRQVKFLLARELGYLHLGFDDRSNTSPPDRTGSFQKLLNDFKAAYFGGVLLMPRAPMLADLNHFFSQSTWQPQLLLDMLSRYEITPEMLMYRFSELIPQFFGIRLHFLRFHNGRTNYRLIKQLNMSRLLVPSGIGLHEHFCRRWLSVRILQELEQKSASSTPTDPPLVGVQMSEFLESGDKFFCIGIARPLAMRPDVNSSVVIGFRMDTDLKNEVRFTNDPAIPRDIIHETCERCPLTAAQCDVRGAEPVKLLEKQAETERRLAMSRLAAKLRG